jgi:hypothetical protein
MVGWCLIIANWDGNKTYPLGQKMLNSNSKDKMFYTVQYSCLCYFVYFTMKYYVYTQSLWKTYHFFPSQRELSFQLLKERFIWKTEKKIICQPTKYSEVKRCRSTHCIFHFVSIAKGFISVGNCSENPLISMKPSHSCMCYQKKAGNGKTAASMNKEMETPNSSRGSSFP